MKWPMALTHFFNRLHFKLSLLFVADGDDDRDENDDDLFQDTAL